MKRHSLLISLALVLLATSVFAKDSIEAAVTPMTGPTPIIKVNGTGLTPGNWAVGTIQLIYTVNATNFTAGDFATFQLDLNNVQNNSNPATIYPAVLTLYQTGSSNLVLSPLPATLTDQNVSWNGGSLVTISIPASVANDPSLNTDGTDLVGNLQIAAATTSGGQAHLDTTTTIQVHIKLVYPETACLRVYDFVTDQDYTTGPLSSIILNVNAKGKVTSTNPYGQLSNNLLVANTCQTDQSFDALVTLDNRWQTNPSGNPGNAVFTFLTGSVVDPSSFDITAFGTGSPQQQNLCVQNITVPAGDTFLMTVHMNIISGNNITWYGSSAFGFTGTLTTAGTACTGSYAPLADPDPATTTLTWTTK